MSLVIRAARKEDSAEIFALIRELAEYEKLSHEVDASEALVTDALFSPSPRLYCDIAEWSGTPVGFAVWFLLFSTFLGRPSLYLEDIFVRQAFRRRGIGKALLVRLARHCVANGYGRFEWSVLDWNAPAIAFYKSIGAKVMDEWRICRLSGEALQDLAGQSKSKQ